MNQKLTAISNTSQTSEFVSSGHVDKVADQIADAVLDAVLKADPLGRVACEVYLSKNTVLVGGEMTTTAEIDVAAIARKTIEAAGYADPKVGFDTKNCTVINAIGQQSSDIAQGVAQEGAGDQGIMLGYATDETESFMPLTYDLARKLILKQEDVRKLNSLAFLGPDAKAQVTLQLGSLGAVNHLKTVVFSTQHDATVLDPKDASQMSQAAREKIIATIVLPVIPPDLIDEKTEIFINPTGRFLFGGPAADTGLTGRKIVVDAYGPTVPVGGGAFSGKDPSKVDRSAAYMMRYLAKNIVGAGLASKCLAQVAYAIGQKYPVAFELNFEGTGLVPEQEVRAFILDNFALAPNEIINYLALRKPIYLETAKHGHFGIDSFSWESLNLVPELKARFDGNIAAIFDAAPSTSQYKENIKNALKALGAPNYAAMALENMLKVTEIMYYKSGLDEAWVEALQAKALLEAPQTYPTSSNPEREALQKLSAFLLAHYKTAIEYEEQKAISRGAEQ